MMAVWRVRGAARGFTLFEVMISLLVLTTAVLSTLALLPLGIKSQQLARSQMFASSTAMTLINNFHTPIDKLEGVSRLAPRYDGIKGVDTTSLSSAPFTGWAGAILEQEVHASPYQPNLEQQMGWLNGVLPVPTEIARRIDSDNDEIQRVIDQGGVLLYPDPNFMMGLNQGAAMDKTLQVLPAPELQKLVFAVTSLPQQNALSSLPSESLPWYEVYPFPPEWISMQAIGRETRRLVGAGGNEGQGSYYYPWPAGREWWFFAGARAGWPSWWWLDNWWGPWPDFKRSGMAMNGSASMDIQMNMWFLSWDDGGHGRYEPLRFGVPMRPGQEQDAWFKDSHIDDPDNNDDYLNPQVLNLPPGTTSTPYGNGFYHGRNWRFFASKLGGLWKDGNGVVSALPGYAWDRFQRVAGGDDAALRGPRQAYTSIVSPGDPLKPGWFQDPMDPSAAAKNCRQGWLPIRALLTNPDFPAYEHLQNLTGFQNATGGQAAQLSGFQNVTSGGQTSWWQTTPFARSFAVEDLVGSMWKPKRFPARGTVPWPDGTYISKHCGFWPWGRFESRICSLDDATNLTMKAEAPRTVNPPASYEMRANYRDRAIDLWQAVMPRYSLDLATEVLKPNPSSDALVSNDDGGTMVDCNKYEFGPSELDKFRFIAPKDLDPRDLPIHPAQVMALSYLAHAAMQVTGYSPPFSADFTTFTDRGILDTTKVAWECLNWTYRKTPHEPNAEVSLWATKRPVPTDPPGFPIGGAGPDADVDDWERPWDWNMFMGTPLIIPPSYTQQWPISQPVPGQGITKDALVVVEDVPPGAAGATSSHLKLRNDTMHGWCVYPGDELVFQISYYQWWYKYGKPCVERPAWGQGNNFWAGDDAHSIFDGRYDPDGAVLGGFVGPGPKYPNTVYQCQTFHVTTVTVNGVPYAEGGAAPPGISGSTSAFIEVDISPALPRFPRQYNDARAVVPAADLDAIALHKDTLVRRVANPHDVAFARKAYEMCLQWAAAYAAESPNDFGAPRPANRQTMMDKPLALYDLFYDAGNGSGDGRAVRVPQHPPTSDGSASALGARRNESFYRWMVPDNLQPDSWFYPSPPASGRHASTHLGPGRERQDFFAQMVYNDQLKPPTPGNDHKRFWLTQPFAAFHRGRALTFWSVDWKAYEDAEMAPSAPADFAKHDRYLRRDPNTAASYDVIAPWVDYGHSPLCGNPESLYVWTDPSRQRRYVDVVGGESAGYLYQNWIGGLGMPRPGLHDETTGWPTQVDPPPTNGQLVSADVHLGHWGADRNGNGVLDVGPVPRGARMKAVHVVDFDFYDPVLRLHYGN